MIQAALNLTLTCYKTAVSRAREGRFIIIVYNKRTAKLFGLRKNINAATKWIRAAQV